MDEKHVIGTYVDGSDWRKAENANESYSISGLAGHIARTAVARYMLHDVYAGPIADAHLGGTMYIHDLGMGLSGYCVGLDFKQMLEEGLGGVPGKTASAPPSHFRTALGQLVNWIFLISQEVAGAVAVSSFDTFLAPFVFRDNLSYDEVRQGIQEFVYNLNQPTRIAFQSPFSNITMDLVADGAMADEEALVGGTTFLIAKTDEGENATWQTATYGDFQKEMDIINKAFAEVMTAGDVQGRVFTFPIPTYNITKNFDWNNPSLEGLWRMTGKYGIPYFANFINSDMKAEDVRSMCCRLRIDVSKLSRRGGLFSSNPTTGSIGVVTINLPHLAKEATMTSDMSFSQLLHDAMDLAAESLNIKRAIVEENTERGLFPYMEQTLKHVKKNLGSYWANHFNSIGLIGMEEAVTILGYGSISTTTGIQKSREILEDMLGYLQVLQDRNGIMFNLEASPAETATYVLAKTDLKRWPDMFHQGTKETPYYTNSALPPANFTENLWESLNVVDGTLPLFTGGSVSHVYLGESIPDPESVKQLVKTIATHYAIPYFSITPTFSICPIHGYISGEHPFCPICDEERLREAAT